MMISDEVRGRVSGLSVLVKPKPPASRTRPSERRVAEWHIRGSVRLGLWDQVPVVGSKTSLGRTGEASSRASDLISSPPVARTRPSDRRVSVYLMRGSGRTISGSPETRHRVIDLGALKVRRKAATTVTRVRAGSVPPMMERSLAGLAA